MTPDKPAMPRALALLVDDDTAILKSLQRALQDSGLVDTLMCADAREATRQAIDHDVAVILLDLIMPHRSGEQVLAELQAKLPGTPVILVTATDEVATAVRCIKAGAYDYLTKPLDFDRLIATVSRALDYRRLQTENRELRKRTVSPKLKRPELFEKIVTQSPGMLALFAYMEAIAPSAEPVLIMGETGTGKELIAEALHHASGRAGRLVPVNVAGLDETAFTDTLFGHTRGAFTGATLPREGLVAQAAGGSLFLDEIGDLKIDMQTKLLRLIQEREYFPLGSDKPHASLCRVLAATNRNLDKRKRDGQFREDLLFRLNTHLIRVPPLRERLDDLPVLIETFLREAARALSKPKPTPPRELTTYLSSYAFPGNVRELRTMLFDAVAQHEKGVLSLRTFLEHMARADEQATTRSNGTAGPAESGGLTFGPELPTLKGITSLLLSEALKRTQGNQSAAACLLGISRRTMNRYATTGLLGLPSDGEHEPDEP